ncbi:hypothetical protein BZL68_19160 [Escherichia coli]|nr:hypothetical protein BZL68_19160 [Escherichia coli]
MIDRPRQADDDADNGRTDGNQCQNGSRQAVSDYCVHGYLSGFIGFCPRTGLSVPVSDLRL